MWTRTGYRLRDIGDDVTWLDLRGFIAQLPPDGSSAFYRARYPKSWWWTPLFDMLAALLQVLSAANWQRGGGKGQRPKMMQRPKEARVKKPRGLDPKSPEELEERRQRMREMRKAVARGD